jgi:hypothetical protein
MELLRRPRHSLENNIKMDFNAIEWGGFGGGLVYFSAETSGGLL